MNAADVVVATMTRVNGRDDGEMIVRALSRLVDHDLPIVVSDRNSPQSFRDRLGRLRNVTIVEPQGDGLVGQVTASITRAIATGRRVILYTEPDKDDFFSTSLRMFLDRSDGAERAGITVAARSASAFDSFPLFQKLAESAGNELCRDVIGMATDYFYGPFLITSNIARLVNRADVGLGWGWRPFVFASAAYDGYRISAVEGDFRCPPDQQQEDDAEKQHRMRQFAQNMRGLLAAAGIKTAAE